jgi:hypothetical protein
MQSSRPSTPAPRSRLQRTNRLSNDVLCRALSLVGSSSLMALLQLADGTDQMDAICRSDVASLQGFTISWKFVAHMADSFIQSGEVAQRHSEVKERAAGSVISSETASSRSRRKR